MHLNNIVDYGSTPPAQTSLVNSVLDSVFKYKQLETQSKLAKINLQRVQAGQSAITFDMLPGSVPTFAIAPDAQTAKAGLIGGGVLVALGVAAVAVLALKK